MQEFSMIAGKTRNNQNRIMADEATGLKLLKFGSVFGANASGKSNLIKSILFSKIIACNGIPNPQEFLQEYYFKLDEKNKTKPSYFEFEMKIDGKCYAYGFELILNEKEFTSEWLYEINNENSKKIFERNVTEETINLNSSLKNIKDRTLKKKFEVYTDDIKNNKKMLFLKDICFRDNLFDKKYKNDDIEIFRKVYLWIQNLVIIDPSAPPYYNYLLDKSEDESQYQKIRKIIKSFGTGITDYKIGKCTLEESDLSIQEKEYIKNAIADAKKRIKIEPMKIGPGAKDIRAKLTISTPDLKRFIFVELTKENDPIVVKTLSFKHGTGDLNIMEESDGTKRLLDLIEIFLYNENCVCFVDELDRSLHPQLTRKFIEAFLKNAIDKNTQLIITTHESRLLDLELLRRDEIWFVDKNKKGESSIYSLDEYNERFDKKIDKAYFEGRYGGVPIFEEIFPNLGENDEN